MDIKSDLLIMAQLNKICLNGSSLLQLDLSGLALFPHQLSEIMSAIGESCLYLNYLNLSHNTLSTKDTNEHSSNFCKKLCKLIEESDKL